MAPRDVSSWLEVSATRHKSECHAARGYQGQPVLSLCVCQAPASYPPETPLGGWQAPASVHSTFPKY
ncbi:unnamed protein product, partial [Pleuronectes platessa]